MIKGIIPSFSSIYWLKQQTFFQDNQPPEYNPKRRTMEFAAGQITVSWSGSVNVRKKIGSRFLRFRTTYWTT
jgi:hypothetical protein